MYYFPSIHFLSATKSKSQYDDILTNLNKCNIPYYSIVAANQILVFDRGCFCPDMGPGTSHKKYFQMKYKSANELAVLAAGAVHPPAHLRPGVRGQYGPLRLHTPRTDVRECSG
jgi:hypothetical protein